MQNLIVIITQENTDLLNTADLGCFILPTELNLSFIEEFTIEAHKQNKLVLLSGENAPDIYQQTEADGLFIDTTKDTQPQKQLKNLKAKFPKAIIGAICRNRRHEAMLVSECEPDFVAFKFWNDGFANNKELLDWYNDLFLIQNAALIEEECDFHSLNADFLIIDDKKFKILVAK